MAQDQRPGGRRSRRETIAERRERRAAVDDPGVVLEAALRFLEPRARSVAEVRRRLADAGYRAELIEGAVERLLELGMLDDEAFARHWLESRDRARPRGEHALRRELRLKGIDDATVDAALAERRAAAVTGPGSAHEDVDRAAAERLLARHVRTLERVADPRARRQRAYALLARNGFDPSVASEVARSIAERSSGADEDVADP